jgi:hypothetical protein
LPAANPTEIKPSVSLVSVIGENPSKINLAAEPATQMPTKRDEAQHDTPTRESKSAVNFDKISATDALTTKADVAVPAP